ncbi:MAG TPA: hypothetical protein VKS21_06965 [Spirochaetota bacterium]|nr:hypothetical protein [Spirochaetota bacterium]
MSAADDILENIKKEIRPYQNLFAETGELYKDLEDHYQKGVYRGNLQLQQKIKDNYHYLSENAAEAIAVIDYLSGQPDEKITAELDKLLQNHLIPLQKNLNEIIATLPSITFNATRRESSASRIRMCYQNLSRLLEQLQQSPQEKPAGSEKNETKSYAKPAPPSPPQADTPAVDLEAIDIIKYTQIKIDKYDAEGILDRLKKTVASILYGKKLEDIKETESMSKTLPNLTIYPGDSNCYGLVGIIATTAIFANVIARMTKKIYSVDMPDYKRKEFAQMRREILPQLKEIVLKQHDPLLEDAAQISSSFNKHVRKLTNYINSSPKIRSGELLNEFNYLIDNVNHLHKTLSAY